MPPGRNNVYYQEGTMQSECFSSLLPATQPLVIVVESAIDLESGESIGLFAL